MAVIDLVTGNCNFVSADSCDGGPLMADLLGNYDEETEEEKKYRQKHARDNDDDDDSNLDSLEKIITRELDIDDQSWKNYVDQHPQLPHFDIIINYPMAMSSETVPVDLIFNQVAHDCVNDLAKLAIKWYNARHDTGFEALLVEKANFNTQYTMNKYYITFSAKEEKTNSFNEFVGIVAHKYETSESFVVFCGERFRPKLSENPCRQHLLIDVMGDEPTDHEYMLKNDQCLELLEDNLQMKHKYLEKLVESGLSLLDQPFYPEFVKDEVLPAQDPDNCTPEKLIHADERAWQGYEEQSNESKEKFQDHDKVRPHLLVPSRLEKKFNSEKDSEAWTAMFDDMLKVSTGMLDLAPVSFDSFDWSKPSIQANTAMICTGRMEN